MSYQINGKCIGCTMCAKNCPVYAIDGSVKQLHSINDARCIECGVCGNVCPVEAILNQNGEIASKLPKEKWKKPDIDSQKCSACSLCVDVCFLDCLEISYPIFKGDINVYAQLVKAKECVACNMCKNICPLHAITMQEVTI